MSSENIATIDPLEVFINFGPKRLSGFADAQYFSANKINDDFIYVEGADGEGTFVKVPSNAWALQVVLQQSSRSNDYLWTRRLLDLNTPGGVLDVFKIKHQGTQLVAAKARIIRPADITFSKGVETRTWPFIATFFEGTLQGITS